MAPQLALTAVFFLWPAGQAIWFSTQRQDAFGLRTEFVGLENFSDLFADPLYRDSIGRTAFFCAAVAALAMAVALLLAVFADREIRGRGDLPHPADLALRGRAGRRRRAVDPACCTRRSACSAAG